MRLKKFLCRALILFLSIFFVAIGGFLTVLYSPFFTSYRDLFVTSAMTSLNHQYLAELFFSSKDIDAIMAKNTPKTSSKKTDTSAVQVAAQSSAASSQAVQSQPDTIQSIDIKSSSYVGHLLIISDPKKIHVAYSDRMGVRGEKLKTVMSSDSNLIAGINAGGFVNDQSTGGVPLGSIISQGSLIYGDKTTPYSMVGITNSGVLTLGTYTPEQALEQGITEAVTFEPFLIVNGQPMITSGNGGWGIAPRTAIGQTKDGKMLLLVIDGRQVGYSVGATLREVQDLLLQYGAYNAANLDGGASTVMYYNGQLMNKPCGSDGERYLPSMFVVEK